MLSTTTERLEWLEEQNFAKTFLYIKPRWAARLGDEVIFENTLEECIHSLYNQAVQIRPPCYCCYAFTEAEDIMYDGECLNCHTTRVTERTHFNLGLVRTNTELERTASILNKGS